MSQSAVRKHWLAACWVLCALLISSASAFSKEFESLEIGAPAPDFTLKDLAEKEYSLSDLKGEIVVLQFGSSTTMPFVEQIKPIIGLTRKYRRQGVTFLTVYTIEQDFSWQADDYFSKHERAKGLRFQVGAQSGQRMTAKILVDDLEETVYKAYGSVPAGVFIVDKAGNLAFKAKVVNATDVEKVLEELL